MVAPPASPAAAPALDWRSLFRWRGTIDRRSYIIWGCGLTALKMALDWTLTTLVFGRAWNVLVYLAYLPDLLPSGNLSDADRSYYLAMAALAVPFIWFGTLLTVQRLRSAGIASTLVLLFFVPPLNFLFFGILAFLPDQVHRVDPTRESVARPEVWIESQKGAVFLGVLTTVVLVGSIAMGANVLRTYGVGIFLGVPFVCGFISASFLTLRRHRSARACIGTGVLANLLLGLILLLVNIEGILCLLMALPIALPIGMIGSHLAAMCQPFPETVWLRVMVLLFLLPLAIANESPLPRTAPVRPVVTSVVVHAPIGQVWQHVVAFPPLAPPRDLVFRMGVAYPIGARIHGTGVGAVRHCVFSTGSFVEPITAWREPELLAFDVAAQPDALRELGLWEDLRPAHLDGGVVSRRGQFRLEALADGTTRLEGTTWYEVSMWPNAYWRLWGDAMIHRIHGRVLEHVKALAEAPE